MSEMTRSEGRSAVHGAQRTDLRTGDNRRPPRRHWDQSGPRPSLWQLTTRPPRSSSGSQLPVKGRGQCSYGRGGRR